jgi:DNA-binding NtrC family response regulator
VGSTQDVHVDVRIVAATNADLSERMDDGSFLRDLYDRLAFEVIEIPPLRERPEDVDVLAPAFVDRFCVEILAGSEKTVTPAALNALRGYPFPGNVRELKSIVERACFHDRDGKVDVDDLALPPEAQQAPAPGTGFSDDPRLPLDERVDSFEAWLCKDALERTRYKQKEAAALLGITYDQFRQRYRKYGLGKE